MSVTPPVGNGLQSLLGSSRDLSFPDLMADALAEIKALRIASCYYYPSCWLHAKHRSSRNEPRPENGLSLHRAFHGGGRPPLPTGPSGEQLDEPGISEWTQKQGVSLRPHTTLGPLPKPRSPCGSE